MVLLAAAGVLFGQDGGKPPARLWLKAGWLLKSSAQVKEGGEVISTTKFIPEHWYPAKVPCTVLGALVHNGVYPDPRVGLNCYQIPDSSDEFNRQHKLEKFSYLPDKRNPWRHPYWYRTEFDLAAVPPDGRVWLEFKGVNYRADVWLNGRKVSDRRQMVGMFLRFRMDVTSPARVGRNCVAVLVSPVDHPGEPDVQWEVFGRPRNYTGKDLMKDVTFTMGIGYDCMPTIPDRAMGLWQEVSVEITGPVDVRDPFVVTDLPLPKTDPAFLTVSADLVNTSRRVQSGVLRGVIAENGVAFGKKVELAPGEIRRVACGPKEFRELVIAKPRLWWPRQYGRQDLYHLSLTFESGGAASDTETVTFGIRKVTSELHWFKGTPGLRLRINGQKVFAQGGWLQPDMLFDMPAARTEAEVRYLAEANLHTVTFEDVPLPNDAFLEACDRYGLMYWCSFYGSYWVGPLGNRPLDRGLLAQCGEDVIKRCCNHPSVILYSCVGEGSPDKDVYLRWRKAVREMDGTRLFVPTIDVRKGQAQEWFKEELPTGLHDDTAFGWRDPATYYRNVRDGGTWTFNTEVGFGSLPPVDSLRRFLPDLFASKPGSGAFPLDKTWAHHGANSYYKAYDDAIRRLYGEPEGVVDYCMKAHLVTATQHRAWSEAVNHRLWEITSGLWEWKVNSCWPDVNWQIYDWYLRPMVSAYYYRLAFEPLHVQLSPLDGMVTVINRRVSPEKGLTVDVSVLDGDSKLLWRRSAAADVAGETYRDVFAVPRLELPTPVYFAALKLRGAQGKIVSRNFYWLSAKEPADYRGLSKLPMVKLRASHEIERVGEESVVRARVANPTDRVALFVQLALTRTADGAEILPVFWDDNYFSLAPGEEREVTARVAARDLDDVSPQLEIGGWNVESDCRCTALVASKSAAKAGETISVTATVAATFLNGSRLTLLVDDHAADGKWVWARGGRSEEVSFQVRIFQTGEHRLTVRDRAINVRIE